MNDTSSALVLFSGGQDSTTCLAWALSRYERVETIGFAYGQRHAVEMEVRKPVRRRIAAVEMDMDIEPHGSGTDSQRIFAPSTSSILCTITSSLS